MALTLVKGTVTHVARESSAICFQIRKHTFRVSRHPDLLLLENGEPIQMLVDANWRDGTLDVLAMKCEGSPPIYLGPRLGLSCSLAAAAVAATALISHHEWLLLFPAMLAMAKGYFLRRRAWVFESFANELAEPRNLQ